MVNAIGRLNVMTPVFLKTTTGSVAIDITETLGRIESKLIRGNSNSRAIPVMQSQDIQMIVATQNGDVQGDARDSP